VGALGSLVLGANGPGFFLSETFGVAWALSPDGREVVARSDENGESVLRRIPATGSSTQPGTVVATRANPVSDLTWSPDGTRLAWLEYHSVGSYQTLVVAPLSGGTITESTASILDGPLRWLPDSTTIVGNAGGTVAFYDTSTKVLSRTTVPGPVMAVAPDSRRVAIITTPPSGSRVLTTRALDPNTRAVGAVQGSVALGSGAPEISALDFAPTGKSLLVSAHTLDGFLATIPVTSTGGLGALTVVPGQGPGSVGPATWQAYRPTVSLSSHGSTATVAITSTGLEAGTTYACSVDGAPALPCSSGWATPSLPAGRHTVVVTSTAPGGRVTSVARTWTTTLTSRTGFFTPLAPKRLLDTRTGLGAPKARVSAGRAITLTVPGLPADATAVVLNVTAVRPSSTGVVTVYPAGATRPTASNLNFEAGRTVANAVTVRVSAGKVTLHNAYGTVDLVADLAGFYARGTGAGFTSMAPVRVLDTRSAVGTPVGSGATVVLSFPTVPASATAVTFNLTAVAPTSATTLTAYPTGVARPLASNLNVIKGETRANLVTVKLGKDRSVTIHNASGSTHVLADLAGYYQGGSGLPLTVAVSPTRFLDTRIGLGAPKARLGAGAGVTVSAQLPTSASALVANVTAVQPTNGGHVTVYPAGQARPNTSTINLARTGVVPNLATVGVGTAQKITLENHTGSVDLVADLAGWFSP
jgi:hypothetical protein